MAIGLAALAVVVLTLGLGAAPWTGADAGRHLRRLRADQDAGCRSGRWSSVFVETLILAPLALVWLWGMHTGAWTDLGGRPAASSGRTGRRARCWPSRGPLTGGPLILFSYAARRIPYATLGLVQYLNPTLQFAVAVALFGEPFTGWHARRLPADLVGARALFLGRAGGSGVISRASAARLRHQLRHGVVRLEEVEEARVGEALRRRCGRGARAAGSSSRSR